MSAAADDSRGDVPDVDPEASLRDEVSEAFRQHVLYFQYTSTPFAGYNELFIICLPFRYDLLDYYSELIFTCWLCLLWRGEVTCVVPTVLSALNQCLLDL